MCIYQIEQISKIYNDRKVLDHVNFQIEMGKVVVLIGPNGAGKSTLLNILAGIIFPDAGRVIKNDSLSISFYLGKQGFFSDITVQHGLSMLSSIMNGSENQTAEILKNFKIDFLRKRYGRLSSGMKQKVALAVTFFKDSDFYVLDEPTNNLDIDAILALKRKISSLKKKKKGFLISSHQINEFYEIADSFAFLKDGKLKKELSKEDLCNSYSSIENAYDLIIND